MHLAPSSNIGLRHQPTIITAARRGGHPHTRSRGSATQHLPRTPTSPTRAMLTSSQMRTHGTSTLSTPEFASPFPFIACQIVRLMGGALVDLSTWSSPSWPGSEKIFHFMLFATRRRREPSRPAASVPLHTARHAVCNGTLAVSRRCRVRHWQRNNPPGLCSADGGVEQMKKILSE